MKKFFKYTGIGLGCVLLLPVLIIFIVYLPPVQNWAAERAMKVASESTGLDITLDRVSITPLLDVCLQNLTAVNRRDTVVHTDEVIVDLDFTRVLTGRIGVDAVILNGGVINTMDLIDQLRVMGRLGKLQFSCRAVDVKKQKVVFSTTGIQDCDLDICMRDTTVVDTTESSPIEWSLEVHGIAVSDSRISYHSAGDSLSVLALIEHADLSGGDIGLYNNVYRVGKLDMAVDSLSLKLLAADSSVNCISLPSTSLVLEGLLLDSTSVHLRDFELATNLDGGNSVPRSSRISGCVDMDFNAFTPGAGGNMRLNTAISVSRTDLMLVVHDFIPDDLRVHYPDAAIDAVIACEGNIDRLRIDSLWAGMRGAMDLRASGEVANVMSDDDIRARMNVNVETHDMDWLLRWLGIDGVRLPHTVLDADAVVDGHVYCIDANLKEGRGCARASAELDADAMSYRAKLTTSHLDVRDYVPAAGIGDLSASLVASGIGTDLLDRRTRSNVRANVGSCLYDGRRLGGMSVDAKIGNGHGVVDLSSFNDILQVNACIQADLDKRVSNAEFELDMSRIDLMALGLTKDTLTLSMIMNMNGTSNLDRVHKMDASIVAIELLTKDSLYHPLDIRLGVDLDTEKTKAYANAGDLKLDFCCHHSLDTLLAKADILGREFNRQLNSHALDFADLKSLLPDVDAHLFCNGQNPIANMLRMVTGYRFDDLKLDIESSPVTGITGGGLLEKLNTGSVMIDTIQLGINSLQDVLNMEARVKNGPKNRIVNFETLLRASLNTNGFDLGLKFFDGSGEKGIDLGMEMLTVDSIIKMHITPLTPVVAFRHFTVNGDNYISFDKNFHVEANLDLVADDGTGVKVYSTPGSHADQDLTISVNSINLRELSSVMPFMPRIGGKLHGDAHILKEGENTTVSTNIDVERMMFEGCRLGRIGMELAYFPNPDGTHLVDGVLRQENREIALLQGKYWNVGEQGMIEASATLEHTPLNILNGFIPNSMARLEGYLQGMLSVSGSVDKPLLSGTLHTDSLHICSDPYSVDLRIPDDDIVIEKSFLNLNRIQAFANGNNPLTLDGSVNFADLENIVLDMAVNAKDFNLINSPRRKGAEAFGKVYFDLDGSMRGTLSNLDIKGRLNVSGKTNMTYVLKDSPLSIDDQLNSMVTFCDFTDTVEVENVAAPEQNIRMNIQIGIDEAATVNCFLSEDGQDNIRIEGGGNLTMTYDVLQGLRAFGRYTILSGKMDYSMVVVSLKDFKIDQGSYVEFSGDILNPHMNISAHEEKKSSVTDNKITRTVLFDVGLKITQSLKNLGLEFTLEAPNDMVIQNELASMSAEDRGRAAVAMLTTGMYLSTSSESGGTGGFNGTNALNSFLQNQISSIAGKALKTVDIGFGIDNTKTAQGDSQTDYNFSFAKRFWGNRISVIIGGKVSSGNNAKNNGQSIINNVAIEYRLDNSGTRYVKAFYNKNQETLLESEVMEMGASLLLRRKTEKLVDLFIFTTKKKDRLKEAMKANSVIIPEQKENVTTL